MRPRLAEKTLRLRFMTLMKPPRATVVQVSIHAIFAPLDGEPYTKMPGHPVLEPVLRKTDSVRVYPRVRITRR